MHDVIESTGIKYKSKDSYDIINRIDQMRKQVFLHIIQWMQVPNVKIITVKDQVDKILNYLPDIKSYNM